VFAYALDPAAAGYVLAGVAAGRVDVAAPFRVDLTLAE